MCYVAFSFCTGPNVMGFGIVLDSALSGESEDSLPLPFPSLASLVLIKKKKSHTVSC